MRGAGARSGGRRATLLLLNRNAGRVEEGAPAHLARLLAAGGPVDPVVTSDPEEVDAAMAALDDRLLVVAGGDGTIHHAVNRLDRHGRLGEVDVALVPLGTANALARGLGIPVDAAAACRTALHGHPRRFDVLEGEDGRLAVNDVHTGIGVVAQGAMRTAKRLVGSLAYPAVNAVTGLCTPGWGIRVEVDGCVLADDADRSLGVAIGNGPLIGNGIELWPGARPQDGVLDVVVARARGRLRRLPLAHAVARSRHAGRDDVVVGRGRRVRIEGGPGRHRADGELWHGVTTASYRVRPRAWRLMTPPAAR